MRIETVSNIYYRYFFGILTFLIALFGINEKGLAMSFKRFEVSVTVS